MRAIPAMLLGVAALATASDWTIDASGNLVWKGAAFRPMGRTAVPESAAKGAPLLVEVGGPAAFGAAMAAGEQSGSPFLVRFTGFAPRVRGWTVRPQSYRITDPGDLTSFTVDLPGTEEALVVVAGRRDGVVRTSERIPVIGGKLSFPVAPGLADDQRVVLVYPLGECEESDLWEGWDRRRDEIVSALRKSPPGPNFRGLADPAGRTSQGTEDPGVVPVSPVFRAELRDLLETRYRNIDTALKSWGLSGGSVETFEDLAALIPLWNGVRGIPQYYQPSTNKMFGADTRRSAAWTDLENAVHGTVERRHRRLVTAIKAVADMPVLVTWRGFSPIVEDGTAGYDGLLASVGGGMGLPEAASRPLSTILRRKGPGLLYATDVPDARAADVLAGFGFSGGFGPGLSGEWPSGDRPRPFYFPEAAANPAAAQLLPGGGAWLPSPSVGAPLDLGPGYHAYRYAEAGVPVHVLWSDTPGRVRLLMASPEKATFEATDGSDPAPKSSKGGAEVFLGSLPLVVRGSAEVPVPQPALNALKARLATLLKWNETLKRNLVQETSVIDRHLVGFETNPGGNFLTMRAALESVEQRLGEFLWLEAETTRDTTFGEARVMAGCSNGAALVLQNRIAQPTPYVAEFTVPVRSAADQTLWIAVRTGDGAPPAMTVKIGAQVMKLDPTPVGRYGQGFAWYGYGLTKLAGSAVKIRLEVDGARSNDLMVDALLLTPGASRPDGIRMLRAEAP